MPKSHGTGKFIRTDFRKLGNGVVFESGVLVFHPENITIGDDVYIGHQTILKGYYNSELTIGNGTWIGQQCFFHGGGNLRIGKNVGIGPGVKIITSYHSEEGINKPVLQSKILFEEVTVDNDSDLGIGSIVLPGVKIGKGVVVGAGAVVTKDVPDYAVVIGSPARIIRYRNQK